MKEIYFVIVNLICRRRLVRTDPNTARYVAIYLLFNLSRIRLSMHFNIGLRGKILFQIRNFDLAMFLDEAYLN